MNKKKENDERIKNIKKEMNSLRKKLQKEYVAQMKNHLLYFLKEKNVGILYFHTSDYVDRELSLKQPKSILVNNSGLVKARATNSYVSRHIKNKIKNDPWFQIYLEISGLNKKEDSKIFMSMSEMINNYEYIDVSSFCINNLVFDIFLSPGSSIRKDKVNVVIHSPTSEEIFKFLSKNKANITLNCILDSISKHEEIIEYQKKIVQQTPKIFLNIGEK